MYQLPIEFAEVILYENNKPLLSELSGKEGSFVLLVNKQGNFTLTIRHLGEILYQKTIQLESNTDLGVLMVDNSRQLSEITVIAKKQLIEKKSDRLVYNVQNSLLSTRVSSDELLKNIPRIDPTSDGLRIIGKSNVLVMVDDRLLNISGDDLKNYLKTLRSENIDKIEVITNPSAKYDAVGNTGLINIKLKRKQNAGFDANISSTAILRTKASANNAVTLNYSNEKLIFNYNLFYGDESRNFENKNKLIFSDELRESIENTERIDKGLSHQFNADYQLAKAMNFGFYFNYSNWDNNAYGHSEIKFYNNEQSLLRTQQLTTNTLGDRKGLSFSPYLDIKLDTLGSQLKFYYNHNQNTNNATTELNTKQVTDYTFTINALGTDLETTLLNTKLEIGAKATYFNNDNRVNFGNNSNDFLYKERLWASYFNLSRNLTEKLFLSAGVRYEYTQTEGILATQNITNEKRYHNWFPTASFSYEANDNHAYSLSFNQRIARPSLYDLNPFRVYKDANNYEIGNPDLSPNITTNIELGYVYKGNLSFSLYGSKIADNWAFVVSTENSNNTVVTQPKNALTTYSIGSELAYNWEISKRISCYSSANVSYQQSKSTNKNLSDGNLRGIQGTMLSNLTIALNENKTNKVFLNMLYNTKGVEEMYVSKNTFLMRLGASLSFLDQKLGISLYLTDPFSTTIARNSADYSTYTFENRIFNDNRSVHFSVVYKMGNNRSKTNEIQVDNSEKDRLIKDK
ncbi:TonB-dependent receptor [Capnocytophaga sp. HP1101]